MNNSIFGLITVALIICIFLITISATNAPSGDSRGSGPMAYDASGKWYKLMCIDGVQYISSYRRLTVKMLDTGLPATCNKDDVTFNQSNW